MPPRPTASTEDEAAGQFLDSAAELFDAMFASGPDERPPRLRAIDFPAALQWLRIEDVIRLARERSRSGVSRKAFWNRWESKDEFLKDAVVHTMLYRDGRAEDPTAREPDVPRGDLARHSLSTTTVTAAGSLLQALLTHPRSFLLMHIGPLLAQHPDLHEAITERMRTSRAPWYDGYRLLITDFGLVLRPGWTVDRLGMALTCMLDGFLLRSRLQAVEMDSLAAGEITLFADTILAFTLGVVDLDCSGLSTREYLDAAVDRA